jgi:hypothetical protein
MFEFCESVEGSWYHWETENEKTGQFFAMDDEEAMTRMYDVLNKLPGDELVALYRTVETKDSTKVVYLYPEEEEEYFRI